MHSRSRAEGDRGSVTAEFALALPAVVVVLAVCLAATQVATVQVRAHDAASAAARHLARGDRPMADALVARLIPGAVVSAGSSGALTCATVATHAAGLLAAIGVSARACALTETP